MEVYPLFGPLNGDILLSRDVLEGGPVRSFRRSDWLNGHTGIAGLVSSAVLGLPTVRRRNWDQIFYFHTFLTSLREIIGLQFSLLGIRIKPIQEALLAVFTLLDLGHGVDVPRTVGGVLFQISKDKALSVYVFAGKCNCTTLIIGHSFLIRRLYFCGLPNLLFSEPGVVFQLLCFILADSPILPRQNELDGRKIIKSRTFRKQPTGQLQNLLHVDVAFFAVVGVGGHEGAVTDLNIKGGLTCAAIYRTDLLPHHVGVQTSLSVVPGECLGGIVSRRGFDGNRTVSLDLHHVLAQVLDLEDVGAVDLCIGPLGYLQAGYILFNQFFSHVLVQFKGHRGQVNVRVGVGQRLPDLLALNHHFVVQAVDDGTTLPQGVSGVVVGQIQICICFQIQNEVLPTIFTGQVLI